jgi:hypothetical protein
MEHYKLLEIPVLDARRLAPGMAAIIFYAFHLLHWIKLRKLENILWACHIGCLLIGISWLAAWPVGNAIGLLWLLPGIVLWLLYLAGGGLFSWSSLLIHIGGSAVGVWGARVLGVPPGAWWKAGIGYVLLILLSRRVSGASENVNFSRKVWQGWESRFPDYRFYITGIVLGAFALFLLLEQALRRFLPHID